ncbi:MAG: four helix bundle protein [Gemmatimonadetes bacterium]|nr:four helix bundle protein [Gemmatimonadota bacterium]
MTSLGRAPEDCRALARDVYRLTLRQPIRNHLGLAEQLRRAGLSVPANIVEGYCFPFPRLPTRVGARVPR